MKTGLIVDDSKVVRIFTRKILEALNFKVEEAVDGVDALDKCTQSMPDFIILDWNMPNKNGIEFLKDLRHTKDGAKPIVIFCTTENEMSKIAMALETGANEYIMKPFDAEILKNKLIQVGII